MATKNTYTDDGLMTERFDYQNLDVIDEQSEENRYTTFNAKGRKSEEPSAQRPLIKDVPWGTSTGENRMPGMTTG